MLLIIIIFVVVLSFLIFLFRSVRSEDYKFLVLQEDGDLGLVSTADEMVRDGETVVANNFNFTEKVCVGGKCITAEKWNFLFEEGGIYERRNEISSAIGTAKENLLKGATGDWRRWVHSRQGNENSGGGIFLSRAEKEDFGKSPLAFSPSTFDGDVKFSPAGNRVISTNLWTNSVMVHNVYTQKTVKSVNVGTTPRRLDYAPDGRSFAVIASDVNSPNCSLSVWRADTFTKISQVQRNDDYFTSLSYSRDSSMIAAGTTAGKIVLITPSTGAILRSWSAYDGEIEAVKCSPAANVIVAIPAALEANEARVYNYDNGDLVSRTGTVPNAYARCVDFKEGGSTFFVGYGGGDKMVREWGTYTGEELRIINPGFSQERKESSRRLVVNGDYLITADTPLSGGSSGAYVIWYNTVTEKPELGIGGFGVTDAIDVPKDLSELVDGVATDPQPILSTNGGGASVIDYEQGGGVVDPNLRYASTSELGELAFNSRFKLDTNDNITWEGDAEIAKIVIEGSEGLNITDGEHDFWTRSVDIFRAVWSDSATSISAMNAAFEAKIGDTGGAETFSFLDFSNGVGVVDSSDNFEVEGTTFKSNRQFMFNRLCIGDAVCTKNVAGWQDRIRWMTGDDSFDGPTLGYLIKETYEIYGPYSDFYNLL